MLSIRLRNWCMRWAYASGTDTYAEHARKELMHALSIHIISSCVYWACTELAPCWAILHPSYLCSTLLSCRTFYWTTLHPFELCTPYWATLHPVQCNLLSYAAPVWTTHTAPFWEMVHLPGTLVSYAAPYWATAHTVRKLTLTKPPFWFLENLAISTVQREVKDTLKYLKNRVDISKGVRCTYPCWLNFFFNEIIGKR